MSNSSNALATLCIAAVALAGVGATATFMMDRVPEPAPSSGATVTAAGVRHVAILLDRSDSMEDGQKSSCPAMELLVRRAFALPGVTDESQIQAFMSGNSVGEQVPLLGAAIRVPVLEGGEMEMKDTMMINAAIRGARASCDAGMTQLNTSPLYHSVVGVLKVMQVSWGCSASQPCTLEIRSDLAETDNAQIVKALKASGKSQVALIAGLPVVDTGSVEVQVCGTGQSSQKITSAQAEAIEAAWEHMLPGVRISPACL